MDPSLSIAFYFDNTEIVELVSLVVLLFFSAMVSGAEVAFFSLSQRDLDVSFAENKSKAKIISSLLQRPKKLLSTLLFAYNLINLSIALVFFFVVKNLFLKMGLEVVQLAGQLVLLLFSLFLIGKMLAKIAARRNRIQFAQFVAFPIWQLAKLLRVPLYLFKFFKEGREVEFDTPVNTLEFGAHKQIIDNKQKILQGIVSFENTDAKGVMSPRIDIFALDISESFAAVYSKIITKGFSRIPVFKDNLDHIVGVLFVKDLLPYINEPDYDWTLLLREPFFVPENKKLGELLKDFQRLKSHLAIVVDEYGSTSGLLSLEDVIEEIVGEISDEYDDAQYNFSKIDDKNYIFEGKIYLKDFCKIVEVEQYVFDPHKGEAETLAGFILEILGDFPKKGQQILFENCRFVIESADQKRIKQIKVTIE